MRVVNAFLLIILASFAVVSCQKEPDEALLGTTPAACQLIRAESIDSGAIQDTAGYVYTGDKVSKISFTDYFTTFDYTSGRVSKRSYYDITNNEIAGFDNISYNGDGTVAKIETYLVIPQLPAGILVYAYDFTYTAGKLTRMVEKADTSFQGAPMINVYEYDYTYTGNNITKVEQKDVLNNVTDIFSYAYDNKANYFNKKAGSLFTDLFFNQLDGTSLPLALSGNNVTKVSFSGSDVLVDYTLDSQSNLKELLFDGSVVIRYYYKCN